MDACTTARPKHSKRRTANANIVCIASVHDERFLLHRRRRRFIMNADTYAEADPTTPTHPRRRKRCRPMGGGAGAIFLLSIVTTIGPLSRSGVYATKNFCGLTWGDASADCQNSQPCPLGTDEECTSGGQCWGDTTCDTNLGHGILYDKENAQHSRFCGVSWNDANDNCSLKRHCPSGDNSECNGDEDCYSFLSGCNYVDMVGGPAAGASSSSGGSDGDSGRVPSNDPSRSNFCGSDWNDALNNCSKDDHWCPSGANADCPGGMSCFAGTECKYIADLFPTTSPTEFPTESPTPAPIVYDTIENSRFCAEGWEDAITTCRIGSWCPDGLNSDCPGTQACMSWITGCNIIDFETHLAETGQEIFGADHWLLPEDMFPDMEEGSNEPQLPPAEILASMPTPANNPDILYALTTKSPTKKPTTPPPTVYDPDRFAAANHVFCGTSWADANEKCSPETFCSKGAATHRCEDKSDYCWVGVTSCNGAKFVPTPLPTPLPTGEPTRPVTPAPSREPTRGTPAPSKEPTPEPSSKEPTPEPTPLPMIDERDDPTNYPTPRPVASSSTSQASSQQSDLSQSSSTQEEEEVQQTTVIRQSYCATDYDHVMSTCATLSTCNRYKPCPNGYSCFSNVKCVVPVQSEPAPEPEPAPAPEPTVVIETASPITLAPVTNSPITNAPIIAQPPPTYYPTYNPTIHTLSEEEAAQRLTNMNNYCAASLTEVMSMCSYALYTCNRGDAMCGAGTVCFENIVCPDSEAVTRAPVTARPTPSPTPLPTTTPPTSKPSLASISSLESGSGGMIAVAQNYCAQSLDQLLVTCSTAPTCNDGPCPSRMFCFANTICENTHVDETDKPTPLPTLRPTPKPIAPSANILGSGGNGNAVDIPQNYCSKSEDELTSTCATAKTCNDGEGPCSPGSFCFGNYSCPNRPLSDSSISAPVVTDAPIMSPTTPRPVSTSIAHNKPTTNAIEGSKQNYCAQSAQQLEATCAWSPTCNGGDMPCPPDTFCFPNVICESRQPDEDEELLPTWFPTAIPTVPVPEIDQGDTALAAITDPACDELCMQPIDLSDCEYVFSIENLDVLPCTGFPSQVNVNSLCTGTGRCGTDLGLNNCPGDKDVYIRLESTKCVEYGFVDGSGVLPPPGTGGEGTDNNSGASNMLNDSSSNSNEFDDNEAAREASNNSSSGNTVEDWADWGVEQGTFDDGGRTAGDELTGWWLMGNSSARIGAGGWKGSLIALTFGVVSSLLW